MSMAERQTTSFIGVMNREIEKYLIYWQNTSSEKITSALNELLAVAADSGMEIELKVRTDAIFGNDGYAILPQEAMIYGKPDGDDWVFNVPPPENLRDGPEPYHFAVHSDGDSRLSFGQVDHSSIASFRPLDIVSIKIK